MPLPAPVRVTIHAFCVFAWPVILLVLEPLHHDIDVPELELDEVE